MSTHMSGFQSFFRFLSHFESAKLATSSIRVKKLLIQCKPWVSDHVDDVIAKTGLFPAGNT